MVSTCVVALYELSAELSGYHDSTHCLRIAALHAAVTAAMRCCSNRPGKILMSKQTGGRADGVHTQTADAEREENCRTRKKHINFTIRTVAKIAYISTRDLP